jgi:hypothetical protein
MAALRAKELLAQTKTELERFVEAMKGLS